MQNTILLINGIIAMIFIILLFVRIISKNVKLRSIIRIGLIVMAGYLAISNIIIGQTLSSFLWLFNFTMWFFSKKD